MSSGRLPSLRDMAPGTFDDATKKKTALKFKPKAGTRRTKEEREASALKVKSETPKDKKDFHKKNFDNKSNQQRQKRVPRYLNNTHVISSGPLAAGNFVGGDTRSGSGMARRGIVKMEGDGSSLVQKGLLTIENDAGDSDEGSDNDEKADTKSRATKFNMGREYKVGHDKFDEDDIESDVELNEEALQAKRIEELFPVRPVRVRHDDVDALKKDIQETLTEPATREPTPAPHVLKSENEATLNDALEHRREDLQDKLKSLDIDSEYQSIDAEEMRNEMLQVTSDYHKLAKKINKINDKPNRFMLFQLPSTLPSFQDITPKTEEPDVPKEESSETSDASKQAETTSNGKKTKPKKTKKKIEAVPQEELTGRIGSLRVHKSGKITAKIGGIVMEVNRGAETTFIQDLIALNADDEETPTMEYLGRIDDRIVITPKF